MSNNNIPVITIDGPSGSGKGTVSLLLAAELNWNFLDSGSLYRLLALDARRKLVELDNPKKLTELALNLAVEFATIDKGQPPKIYLDDVEITEDIRSEQCGIDASKIAIYADVRNALIDRQRAFRQPPGLVTDGRDMGSVIFPDAILKIFLLASMEERAKRRFKQLKEQGKNVTFEAVLEEMAQRDIRDQERQVAPLKPAHDAICIDTTNLSINDVLLRIMSEIKL